MTVPKGLPKKEAMHVPMPSTIIDSRTGYGSLRKDEDKKKSVKTLNVIRAKDILSGLPCFFCRDCDQERKTNNNG